MDITIRLTEPGDYIATERLTMEAFTDRSRLPGGLDEHCILHRLRSHPDYIAALDYVAETPDGLVGHIVYSHAQIQRVGQPALPIITFGPLSVRPGLQGKGIGGMLVRHTLQQARGLGYTTVAIMGHPAYYPRHGFERGAKFGITAADGKAYDACMAMELVPGALGNAAGRLLESDCFHVEKDEIARHTAWLMQQA